MRECLKCHEPKDESAFYQSPFFVNISVSSARTRTSASRMQKSKRNERRNGWLRSRDM